VRERPEAGWREELGVTRVLWSRWQLERESASNDQTTVLGGRLGLRESAPPDGTFEELFRAHYAALRALLNGRTQPGLALLVVSPEGIEASGWFAARDAAVNSLTVGRHSSADVFLPSDTRLSLRHLVLLLHQGQDEEPAGFRVLSLRTPVATVDEGNTPLEALDARGPVLLRTASIALLLFPTGGTAHTWPEDPEAAWSKVPPRFYCEKTRAGPRPEAARGVGVRWVAPEDADSGVATLVTTLPGPVFPSLTLQEDEPTRGELVVSSSCGRVGVRLGPHASRRGILLGRYDRCDTAGLPVLSDPALSRVHLLVLEVDGALYGIDTASRNGTWCGAERVRAVRIQPGLRLSLAGRAAVEWSPFH
jgi:pSer/pThr/pTyr-binding forkhead associated (FHA) protein